jgi:hypothetical protein
MNCSLDQGDTSGTFVDVDSFNVQVSFQRAVHLLAPSDVNAICHDVGGSDEVEFVVMTAQAAGALTQQ